jgi:hypothetical protein
MAVVVAYMVIEGTTKEELENLVKVAIGKGWQPLGGVAIAGRFFTRRWWASSRSCGVSRAAAAYETSRLAT